MKPMTFLLTASLLVLSAGCQKSGALEVGEWKIYRNPVYSATVTADPTIVRAEDGTFYVYSTATSADLIPILKSTDLINWEYVGEAFESKPDFIPSANLWAPDVNIINGKYVMYYALSGNAEGNWDTGIGVAASESPTGPFTDFGKVFTAEEIGVNNSIDPMYYTEDGRNYMIWGSFDGGIHIIEMSEDGMSVKEGAEKVRLTGDNYEAAYIYKKDGFYYLFAVPRGTLPSSYPDPNAGESQNALRQSFPGKVSTKAYVQPSYRVVLGKSESLTGPYLNGWGQPMLEHYHDYLMGPGPVFAGPGHNAKIIVDDAGTEWFIYHAYTIANEDLGRTLFIDPLYWQDGWPRIKNQCPSSVCDAPVFNKK